MTPSIFGSILGVQVTPPVVGASKLSRFLAYSVAYVLVLSCWKACAAASAATLRCCGVHHHSSNGTRPATLSPRQIACRLPLRSVCARHAVTECYHANAA